MIYINRHRRFTWTSQEKREQGAGPLDNPIARQTERAQSALRGLSGRAITLSDKQLCLAVERGVDRHRHGHRGAHHGVVAHADEAHHLDVRRHGAGAGKLGV